MQRNPLSKKKERKTVFPLIDHLRTLGFFFLFHSLHFAVNLIALRRLPSSASLHFVLLLAWILHFKFNPLSMQFVYLWDFRSFRSLRPLCSSLLMLANVSYPSWSLHSASNKSSTVMCIQAPSRVLGIGWDEWDVEKLSNIWKPWGDILSNGANKKLKSLS